MADENVVVATEAESNDALEAGFNSVRPEQTPVVRAPAAKAEEPAKVEEVSPVVEAEKPDPWKDVPPVVRETLDSVRKSLDGVNNLSERFRAVEGRVGGVLQKVQGFETAMAAAKTVEKTGGDAPSKEQIEGAAKSSEKWKAIVETYPEWAEAMEERLAQRAAPSKAEPPDLSSIRSQIEQEVITPLHQELRETREEMVAMRHPTWKQDAASEGFKAWFGKQTPEVQALAKSPLATKTIELFDAYDVAKKAAVKATKDKQRLENAITPSGVVAPAASEPDADASLAKGFARVTGT